MSKPTLHRWRKALAAIKDGDKEPLKQCLTSCELQSEVGQMLADLIERCRVPLPRGRRPANPVTAKQDAQHSALVDEWLFRKAGMSKDEAIKKAALENGLSETTVKLLCEGRHRSFRESQLNPGLKRKHKKRS